jgi:hypothetical protein
MSVKGSKVSEGGKQVTACSEHRMLAVVPANNIDEDHALRLKIAITSDWDGQSPDNTANEWFGFKNYVDMLRARQCPHTGLLVTKMKFDTNAQWPKIIFQRGDWLDAGSLLKVKELIKSEKVKQLISGTWTPNGRDGVKIADDEGEATEVVEPKKPTGPTPEQAAAKAAAIKAEEDAKAEKAAAEAKAAAKAKRIAEAQAVAAAAAEAARRAAEEDDEGEAVPVSAAAAPAAVVAEKPKATTTKPKATAAVAATATAAPTGPPAGLDDLLKDWGA